MTAVSSVNNSDPSNFTTVEELLFVKVPGPSVTIPGKGLCRDIVYLLKTITLIGSPNSLSNFTQGEEIQIRLKIFSD